jgi:hypothetical protein
MKLLLSLPDEFTEDLDYIKSCILSQDENGEKPRALNINFIEIPFIRKIRKILNIFELHEAVCSASEQQFNISIFIWNQICRLFELPFREQEIEIGLTMGRRMRASFGPPILSCILLALRTNGGADFVQLFRILNRKLDDLEIARNAGLWQGPGGFKKYLERDNSEANPEFMKLLSAFWDEIDAPRI